MDYFHGLNERQKEAVLHTHGALLILAGAGAGKTKTVTHRILHLIADGTAPESILAITFTNKAAKEMRERAVELLSRWNEANPEKRRPGIPFISTFHSLGVMILKENAEKLGLPRHFTIFDKDDAKRAVKQAMEKLGIDPKHAEPNKVLSVISHEKGKGIGPEEYARRANSYNSTAKMIAPIWREYEKTLAEEKALDFDDLLVRTAELLRKDAAVRERYQARWHFINIDEYQDTNGVQYEISKLLVGERKNICVVGDIDQNIYSWRGADIKNIINFEKDYKGAKVILLEQNYRSTSVILEAANQIIAKNTMRREKNLFTEKEGGDKIGLYSGYDEGDEAAWIAHTAKELISAGTPADEIAVLYRANFQSRALEEAFLAHDVPYQLLGTRFFERKEVKDILSFIQAALAGSPSAITRVVNVPARGIGKVTLERIAEGKEDQLSAAMKSKLKDFRDLLAKIRETAESATPSALIKFILKESGLEDALKEEGDDGEERLLNIRELAALASKYDTLPPEEALDQFLTNAALASDQDSLIDAPAGVKLMTVHSSKGLEFDYVFVGGLEENLFPHKRMGEQSLSVEHEEEERRLFYVAVTRARKRLYLTYASVRTVFGSKQVNVPSEFLSDIDDGLTETMERKVDISDDDGDTPVWRRKIVYL